MIDLNFKTLDFEGEELNFSDRVILMRVFLNGLPQGFGTPIPILYFD